MIGRLTGTPVARTLDGVVLDVNGVGYLLRLTLRALRKAEGEREVTIDTYLHVREDALQLYGFAEPAERELFEQLLSVSGVGPKVALAIVSGSTPSDLRRAIARDDTSRFMAIPGIGKKTAQRVVLELKEKLGIEPLEGGAADLVARDALVELGYSLPEAERALATVDRELPAEERVRQALKAALANGSWRLRCALKRTTSSARSVPAASTTSSARSASRSSSRSRFRRHARARSPSTTSYSSVRPAWARRASPTSSARSWGSESAASRALR